MTNFASTSGSHHVMSAPAAPPEARPALTVAFPAGRGVPAWRKRHEQSPVPGRWPYGLDLLGENGVDVRHLELPKTGLADRLLHKLVGPRRRPGDGILLAWDEVTGAATLRVPAATRWAGVIWATDRVERGSLDPDLGQLARSLRLLDGLWVLSRPQVEAVRSWLGPDAPPVHYVPFGIDTDFYAPRPLPERPLVASVGGDRDRDPATLFAALAIVRRARPDVECFVQTRSTLSPPAGVAVVPHLTHAAVRQLYARAQVVAIATRPNLHASGMTVALEAMAVGRPVVACATPGVDDYVLDGATGALVPPRDPEAMAARILGLLADPDHAAAVGRRAREHVEASHTTSTMTARLARLVTGL